MADSIRGLKRVGNIDTEVILSIKWFIRMISGKNRCINSHELTWSYLCSWSRFLTHTNKPACCNVRTPHAHQLIFKSFLEIWSGLIFLIAMLLDIWI